ncbi:hypothetical protein QA584_08935 [Anaerocolumna sp. AGMB13025]|uniref:hypothetical protein n=1 Tax=Anaerocolumna sp. AGMB13025 TaxID=3039116 RepID=UPI00241E7165|nr:hypothetical protein [Anaerocolumna sp. AGMB13025]WFR59192.1 hypothetical protein QA584_08935 [Anaerocolumna sp. AGMB13025]
MKKEKKKPHIYDNGEVDERRYLQKLKADQSMLQAFFNSIPQCYGVPFYHPYSYPVFPQTGLFIRP